MLVHKYINLFLGASNNTIIVVEEKVRGKTVPNITHIWNCFYFIFVYRL